jgi:hypothetical protein
MSGKILPDRSLTKFTAKNRDRFSVPRSWPHPKLRALETVTPPEDLAFSRFKSTPQSMRESLQG